MRLWAATFLLAVLTGCNKVFTPLMVGHASRAGALTVLVGGQSNAYNMVYYSSPALIGALRRQGFQTVTVINCAMSGTSALDWVPGGKVYTACMAQAQGAHIDVIFWNQGENEAEGVEDWTQWEARTVGILAALRRDLKAQAAPFVYARLSDFANTWPHWADMRDTQTGAHFMGGTMVSLDGVPGEHPGGLHFDQVGYDDIARRFARTILDSGL